MRATHGDGFTYGGECLCHGNDVVGPIALSRPASYLAHDFWTGAGVRVVLLDTDTGAHEVPTSAIRRTS